MAPASAKVLLRLPESLSAGLMDKGLQPVKLDAFYGTQVLQQYK
jgi:hypothetical protein